MSACSVLEAGPPHAKGAIPHPSKLLAAAGGLALLGAAYQSLGPPVAHTEAAAQKDTAPAQVGYIKMDEIFR